MSSKQEDILTGVVVADSYTSCFHPLTPGLPHCLQLVAGRALLDYTLEWLVYNGVAEVILYLSSSPAEVKSWLRGSKWCQDTEHAECRPLNITVIVNEDSRSLGDACRDLDEKGIVRGDFLLCHGDLVSNVKVGNAIETHRAKMVKDKNGVMTKVMMAGGEGDVTRTSGQEAVVATDQASGRILFHQRSDMDSNTFPIDLFQHDQVSVHSELSDPGIYYCSPAVLAMFSDNFDKQDMDTLVQEILESDLTDYTIYLEIQTSGTAVRAANPYLMTTVNDLILSRWMYPLVPHPSHYKYSLGHVYQGRGVKVGKGSVLEECVLLGRGCELGAGCEVTSSSLGPGVTLGNNCRLEHCIVQAGATIGPGTLLSHAIIGRDCVVPGGVTLGRRIIIGCGVELRPGAAVEDGARIVASLDDDWGEDGDQAEVKEGDLGPKAFIYNENEDEDEEDDDDDLAGLGTDRDPWGEMYVADEDEDSSDDEEEDDQDLDDLDGFSEDSISESDTDEHDDVKKFRREVMDSINRGLELGLNADNLVLEINGSKHAWNTTLSEVNQCVLYSVLTANISLDGATGKAILPSVLKNINKLSQLLVKYSKSKSGQQYYLEGMESIVTKHDVYLDILSKVLESLYDKDILTDNNILVWYQSLQTASKQDPAKAKIVTKLKPFIEWLEESESESD